MRVIILYHGGLKARERLGLPKGEEGMMLSSLEPFRESKVYNRARSYMLLGNAWDKDRDQCSQLDF